MNDRDAWAAHVMEVARDLRPQDFRPWANPRPDGEPLASAVLVYAPEVLHGQIGMQLARAHANIPDPASMAMIHAQCWDLMRFRLQRGELVARGHRHGSDEVRTLAPTLFDAPEADFARNTLTTCGMTFGGIRVFDPSRLAAPPATVAASPRSRAERWMRENVVAYAPGQRDGRVRECQAALGVTKEDALAGWNALPQAIKGKPRTSGR